MQTDQNARIGKKKKKVPNVHRKVLEEGGKEVVGKKEPLNLGVYSVFHKKKSAKF